jgi:adenylate kinase family enzyme
MELSLKCALLGNAGSGKSTLARKIQEKTQARILDLDNITWDRGRLQTRRPIEDSVKELESFIAEDPTRFIVEGCYGELIESTLKHSPLLIFLDPGEKVCLEHCRNRAWEPHKYSSKVEQDKMLGFLLSWVSEYYRREGPLSFAFHLKLYENYSGPKLHLRSLEEPLVSL